VTTIRDVHVGAVWLGAPSAAALAELVAEQRRKPLAYPSAGMVRAPVPPTGFRRDERTRELGVGRPVFEAVVAGLRSWDVHRLAGLEVAGDPEVAPGAVVASVLRFPVGSVVATCRVLAVDVAHDRWAFTYGTLPHHPERGEELFEVRIDADGQVVARIVACWHPAGVIGWLGSPIARRVQPRVTERYFDAMAHLASRS